MTVTPVREPSPIVNSSIVFPNHHHFQLGHNELDYPSMMDMWQSDTKILMGSLIVMIIIGLLLRKLLIYLVHARQNRERMEVIVKGMAHSVHSVTRMLSNDSTTTSQTEDNQNNNSSSNKYNSSPSPDAKTAAGAAEDFEGQIGRRPWDVEKRLTGGSRPSSGPTSVADDDRRSVKDRQRQERLELIHLPSTSSSTDSVTSSMASAASVHSSVSLPTRHRPVYNNNMVGHRRLGYYNYTDSPASSYHHDNRGLTTDDERSTSGRRSHPAEVDVDAPTSPTTTSDPKSGEVVVGQPSIPPAPPAAVAEQERIRTPELERKRRHKVAERERRQVARQVSRMETYLMNER